MKKFIIAIMLLSSTAFAQQFSSQTVCKAQTTCFNAYGQPTTTAWCQVYGASYVTNGASNNACNWVVVPNVGVECSGYTQVRNAYGQMVWTWQTITAQCPR